MHRLAQLSAAERDAVLTDFFDSIFGGLGAEPAIADRMRASRPQLPDDPTSEQVSAWVELAELVQDDDFRARLRAMTEADAERRASGDQPSPDVPHLMNLLLERFGAAADDGADPRGPEFDAAVTEMSSAFAEGYGRTDDGPFRAWLADHLSVGTDARAERYWQLVSLVQGGTPEWQPMTGTAEWFIRALRARS